MCLRSLISTCNKPMSLQISIKSPWTCKHIHWSTLKINLRRGVLQSPSNVTSGYKHKAMSRSLLETIKVRNIEWWMESEWLRRHISCWYGADMSPICCWYILMMYLQVSEVAYSTVSSYSKSYSKLFLDFSDGCSSAVEVHDITRRSYTFSGEEKPCRLKAYTVSFQIISS